MCKKEIWGLSLVWMISIHFSWFLLIPTGLLISLIPLDFTWFLLISLDFTWFHLISPDFSWFLLISMISMISVISVDLSWFLLDFIRTVWDFRKWFTPRCILSLVSCLMTHFSCPLSRSLYLSPSFSLSQSLSLPLSPSLFLASLVYFSDLCLWFLVSLPDGSCFPSPVYFNPHPTYTISANFPTAPFYFETYNSSILLATT